MMLGVRVDDREQSMPVEAWREDPNELAEGIVLTALLSMLWPRLSRGDRRVVWVCLD